MTSPLDPFVAAGVLSDLDRQVASALGRLAGEERPHVLLGAALAVRAPRHGHICAEIPTLADRIELDAEADVTWPEPGAWSRALAESPLVRRPGAGAPTPLVLDDQHRLYLDRYWCYQARLVEQLRGRARVRMSGLHEPVLRDGLGRLFPRLSEHGAPPDRQRLAALMCVLRGFTVVSGGPGTGKTTVVRKVLALLLEQAAASSRLDPAARPLRVALAAPTGKAAARMKEAIREDLDKLDVSEPIRDQLRDLEAFTLHRLLGVYPDRPTRARHHSRAPVPYDVIVVDEASMIDFALMARLVDAIPTSARLVLLGDRHQLASVEAGAVLGDVCGQGELVLSRGFAEQVQALSGEQLQGHAQLTEAAGIGDCMMHLTRFFRFGPASGIGAVARAIHAGGAADVVGYLRREQTEAGAPEPYDDLAWCAHGRDGQLPPHARAAIVAGCRPFIEGARDGVAADKVLQALGAFRVLTAHRRGRLGVEGLNASIERLLVDQVPGFEPNGGWYIGRPILVRRNDYALRLYNGDIGVVVRHPDDPERTVVAFHAPDGGVRYIGPGRLPSHETVFAMTIHKSQGSQFDHAMVVLPDRASPLLTRELVYTGVTRARTRLTVVGDDAILRQAIERRVQRASGLGDALWGTG